MESNPILITVYLYYRTLLEVYTSLNKHFSGSCICLTVEDFYFSIEFGAIWTTHWYKERWGDALGAQWCHASSNPMTKKKEKKKNPGLYLKIGWVTGGQWWVHLSRHRVTLCWLVRVPCGRHAPLPCLFHSIFQYSKKDMASSINWTPLCSTTIEMIQEWLDIYIFWSHFFPLIYNVADESFIKPSIGHCWARGQSLATKRRWTVCVIKAN